MERMSSMDIGSLPDSTWGDIVEQGLGISFDESPDTVLLTTPGEGGIAAQLRALSTLEARGEIDAMQKGPSRTPLGFWRLDGAGGPPPPPLFGDDISDEALGRVDWGDNEGGFELELDGVLDAPGSYTGQSPGHRSRRAALLFGGEHTAPAAALKRRRSKSGDAPSFASGAKHPPARRSRGAEARAAPRRAPGVNREASVVVDVGCLPQLATIPVLPVPQYESLINFNRTKGRGAAHHCVMCGRGPR
ncbi:hypothetical protein JL720_12852 [Aureococcus anophagefferens]|nr:hypothetical protein JL720_12852 [Aureococcus anophagefferens]